MTLRSTRPRDQSKTWVVRGCGWKARGRFSVRGKGLWVLDEWIDPPPPEGAAELEAMSRERHEGRRH